MLALFMLSGLTCSTIRANDSLCSWINQVDYSEVKIDTIVKKVKIGAKLFKEKRISFECYKKLINQKIYTARFNKLIDLNLEAILEYEKIITENPNLTEPIDRINFAVRKGNFHMYTKSYIQAIKSYENAISYIKNEKLILDNKYSRVYVAFNISYQKIGDCYLELGSSSKAIEYYQFAMNLEKERAINANEPPTIFAFESKLSKYYLMNNQFGKALKSIESVNNYFQSKKEYRFEDFPLESYLLRSSIYLKLKKPKEAQFTINKLIDILPKNYKFLIDCNEILLKCYTQLGDQIAFNAKFKETEELIQNLVEDSSQKKLYLNKLEFLKIKNQKTSVNKQKQLANLLNKKSLSQNINFKYEVFEHLLNEILQDKENTKKFPALVYSFLMEMFIDFSYNIDLNDQAFYLTKYEYLISEALSIINSPDFKNKYLAFEIIEASKSVTLYKDYIYSKKQINNNKKSKIDSLRLKEIELKNNQLFPSKSNKSELKTEHILDKNKLELNSYELFNSRVGRLNKNEAILSLWSNNDSVFIYKKNNFLEELTCVPLRKINKLKVDINRTKSLDSLTLEYKKLYQILFSNNFLSNEIKHLKISPFKDFNNIPFNCLVDNSDKFLIEKVAISISPSLRFFEDEKNQYKKMKTGVFIPEITNGKASKTNSKIPYARIEGLAINKLLTSELYIDKHSSKTNFIKHCTDYNIVHIASHAESYKDSIFDFSHISFTDDSISKNLYLNEIKSMYLNTDLITLSACQTANGKYTFGEGESLSRSFISAGSKSIVSTLWNVNDQSTSEIMIAFYKYLKKGQAKDVALRNAKLEYLENADPDYQHPYYWAGIIAMGDMSPLYPKPTPKIFFILGGLALLFGSGFIYKKKAKLLVNLK